MDLIVCRVVILKCVYVLFVVGLMFILMGDD